MLVVMLSVVFVVFATWRWDADPVRIINYDQELSLALQQADFALAVPERLPDGWQVTVLRLSENGEGKRWRLVLTATRDAQISLDQVPKPPRALVSEILPQGKSEGITIVGLERWQRWQSGQIRALVLPTADSTTIISGKASYSLLLELASGIDFK
jgi:hypothetical protein